MNLLWSCCWCGEELMVRINPTCCNPPSEWKMAKGKSADGNRRATSQCLHRVFFSPLYLFLLLFEVYIFSFGRAADADPNRTPSLRWKAAKKRDYVLFIIKWNSRLFKIKLITEQMLSVPSRRKTESLAKHFRLVLTHNFWSAPIANSFHVVHTNHK